MAKKKIQDSEDMAKLTNQYGMMIFILKKYLII